MSLREIDNFNKIIENQNIKISKQNDEILQLKNEIINISNEVNKIKEILISNESKKNEKNNNEDDNYNILSIIFCKYKQSLLIKNKYIDKNTTLKCKNDLKELGAKWIKNENMQGWLFVGILKDNEKTLEESCQFIVDKLNEKNFKIEIEYE
jgi:hypothetical protein